MENLQTGFRGCLALFFLLGKMPLMATDGLRPGVQVALAVPLEGDLRTTTGTGLAPSVGLHLDWKTCSKVILRGRVDLGAFPSADRDGTYLPFQQSIHTRVKDQSLGGEVLFSPSQFGEDWSLGAGLYAIKWTVDTTNHLVTPTGSFVPSGSSSWTREGLGLLANHRWADHLEGGVRVVVSHYGYQNLPARFAELNLLWTF